MDVTKTPPRKPQSQGMKEAVREMTEAKAAREPKIRNARVARMYSVNESIEGKELVERVFIPCTQNLLEA